MYACISASLSPLLHHACATFTAHSPTSHLRVAELAYLATATLSISNAFATGYYHCHKRLPSPQEITIDTGDYHRHRRFPSPQEITIATGDHHRHRRLPSTQEITIDTDYYCHRRLPSPQEITIDTGDYHRHSRFIYTGSTKANVK